MRYWYALIRTIELMPHTVGSLLGKVQHNRIWACSHAASIFRGILECKSPSLKVEAYAVHAVAAGPQLTPHPQRNFPSDTILLYCSVQYLQYGMLDVASYIPYCTTVRVLYVERASTGTVRTGSTVQWYQIDLSIIIGTVLYSVLYLL